jgi:hypothetical protein
MKTISFFLTGFILSVVAGGILHAQEAPVEAKTGKVLILRNGQVMEGDIEKVDTDMVIRRGMGEVKIAAERALQLCADWDDAYTYVETLIKGDDANDRLKFAHWCQLHQLHDKALLQAKKALELQPKHVEAQQFVKLLERVRSEKSKQAVTPPMTTEPAAPTPTAVTETVPSVDVVADSLISFSTRVQPILMNTCALCHATGRGGDFILERVSSASQKAATQRNLARVLAYVDLDRPMLSPLLEKAVMAHSKTPGHPQPPIPDRSAKTFQTIHAWIEQTITRNPHLKERAARNAKPLPSRESEKPAPVAAKETSTFASVGQVVSRPAPRVELHETKSLVVHPEAIAVSKENPPPTVRQPVPPTAMIQPPMTGAVHDEYDPAFFNERMHNRR